MNVRDVCFKFYWKLQSEIVPTLKYAQSIYEDVIDEYIINDCVWLDLGCGHQLLPPWREAEERILVNRARLIIGLDYDFESLKKHRAIRHRIRGDISELPFANNSFDMVTSNMVFEHLKDPGKQLREIYRILKPGGILIFHTPNIYGYVTMIARIIPECIKRKIIYLLESRRDEDVFSTYYRINSSTQIRSFAEANRFKVEEIRLIASSAGLIMIPPVVFFELLYIRFLLTERGKPFRTNIIAILRK